MKDEYDFPDALIEAGLAPEDILGDELPELHDDDELDDDCPDDDTRDDDDDSEPME